MNKKATSSSGRSELDFYWLAQILPTPAV